MARILVIDNNGASRAALTRLLTQRGYEVVQAATGYEGMRRLAACPPDVLLLDIFLPDLDGIEILRRVRRSFPHVPIVALSGGSPYREHTVPIAARDFGARATFTKPVSPDALLTALEAAIES
jgi:CheY-like chemotaxis protein